MAANPFPLQGQVLLGAVGAFDWSGGTLFYNMSSRKGRFLNQTAVDAKAVQYSYLGEGGAWRLPGCGRGLYRDTGCSGLPSWGGPRSVTWTEGRAPLREPEAEN